MKVKFFALVIFLSGIASHNFAQEKVSLEEAISVALKNNFDVKLVRIGADSAAITNHYAFGGFLPQINATAGYSRGQADSKNITFQDSVRRANNATSAQTTAAIQLNWTLFDGTRMFATRQRIAQLAELGVIRVQNQMMNSVATVTNNYYNIVRQKQQLKAVNELMSVSEERVKLADKKLQVGTGGKPELLQARVDLNTQRAAAIQQETLIQQLKDQLNGLLGMQLPPVFDTSDTIPIDLGISLESILDDISTNNQALAIARQNIAIAKTQIWETRALRSPVISFNSSYAYNRLENYLQTSPIAQRYNRNVPLNYGLFVTIPILNNFNTTRLVNLAEVRLKRTQVVYEQGLATTTVAVRNAYVNYENLKRILQINEENLLLARENVSIAFETFKRGVNTFLELRTAQQSLSDVYNQLIAARYNAKVAEIELLRLKGALLAN